MILRRRFIERQAFNEKGGMERAVEYVYKIADRQINKARGLLTYNALLFGIQRFPTCDRCGSSPSDRWFRRPLINSLVFSLQSPTSYLFGRRFMQSTLIHHKRGNTLTKFLRRDRA